MLKAKLVMATFKILSSFIIQKSCNLLLDTQGNKYLSLYNSNLNLFKGSTQIKLFCVLRKKTHPFSMAHIVALTGDLENNVSATSILLSSHPLCPTSCF